MQKKLFTFLFVIVASIGTINAQYETCDFECVYRDSIRTVFIPPTTFKYDTIKMFCGIEPCSNATRSGDIVIPDSIDCDGYIYSVYRIVNRAFAYCTGITDITQLILPATVMANNCYAYMFEGTNITTVLNLPTTTLAEACYMGLYSKTPITSVPINYLSFTTLYASAYTQMFSGCTRLTNAPNLPATVIPSCAYEEMFANCSSLTNTPTIVINEITGKFNCKNMFYGCSQITTSNVTLNPTVATEGCYQSMFERCTNLTNAPDLPATTLATNCYRTMFYMCSSLTTIPSILPATTLADNCYYYMFRNCSQITTAPELPATTLTTYCYYEMFRNCLKLNYIKCLATNIGASGATTRWVQAIASSGTFTKNSSMTNWTTGVNGIPTGWTVIDAS